MAIQLLEIINKYIQIIKEYNIVDYDIEPIGYRFKAEIIFKDCSKLRVRDYFFSFYRKYSFHWQDEKNNLILRWDNAPHWSEIETLPYHKHNNNQVLSSKEMFLDDVLEYISNKIKFNSAD